MGRECTYDSKFDAGIGIVTDGIICWMEEGTFEVTPHLRQLSGITEDEARDIYNLATGMIWTKVSKYSCLENWWELHTEATLKNSWQCVGIPNVWLYLLSKGFDLFGLIDAGLAKEVTQ